MSTEKMKLRLSVDDLSLGDMEAFEDATGKDIMEVLKPVPVIDEETGRPLKDPDDPKGRPLMQAKVTTKAFVGLVYLALRRENPDLTIDDVRQMKLSAIDFDIDDGTATETLDPTDESAEASNDVS
jgi:hypothetical protein